MDKETLKHLDSQREKQFLLDARQHGFGMAAAGGGGQPGRLILLNITDYIKEKELFKPKYQKTIKNFSGIFKL